MAALLPSVAMAQTTRPAAQCQPDSQPPVLFAKSGQSVSWEVTPHGKVVLLAFGRTWAKSESWRVTEGGRAFAALVAPDVRVPTVFSIASSDAPKRTLGELVVYPDRKVKWDDKVVLIAAGTPRWFLDWSFVVGLPVTWITRYAKLPDDLPKLKENQRALLIVGPSIAGKDLADVIKLAQGARVNVLILDADWFGNAVGPVSVAPAQMSGGLAEIAKQHWPQPLKFASHRKPWPGIANRWAWIMDGNGLPLVEELRFPESAERKVVVSDGLSVPPDCRSLILNYLPWEQRLGRSELADAALLDLLAASNHRSAPHERDVETTIMDSPKGVNLKDRPVLAAALLPPRAVHGRISPQHRVEFVKILDLRGSDEPGEYLATQRQTVRGFVEQPGARTRLLILGDNKMLDEWEWLKLDRAKKAINRPGVVWLSDDELPPSKDNQIRLMLKLTELGVPLSQPSQEEKKQ